MIPLFAGSAAITALLCITGEFYDCVPKLAVSIGDNITTQQEERFLTCPDTCIWIVNNTLAWKTKDPRMKF